VFLSTVYAFYVYGEGRLEKPASNIKQGNQLMSEPIHPVQICLPFTNKKVASQPISIPCYNNKQAYELLNKQLIYFMYMD
jgi:hypothetical protein